MRASPLEREGEVAMGGEGEGAVGGVTVGVAGLGVVLHHMLGRVGGVGGELGDVGGGRAEVVMVDPSVGVGGHRHRHAFGEHCLRGRWVPTPRHLHNQAHPSWYHIALQCL